MPSYRWSMPIAALCGLSGALWGARAAAFQFPPLSDDVNTRQIYSPDAWVGGGIQTNGVINQSPAEFGPAPGLWQRSSDGNPASGESFPVMTAGPLPGGLSPYGFNSSGLFPPVNQPPSIANNPAFGGNGQTGSDPSQIQSGNGQTQFELPGQQFGFPGQQIGPSGNGRFGPTFNALSNPIQPAQFGQSVPNQISGSSAMPIPPQAWSPPPSPYAAPQVISNVRPKPKVSWALDSTQEPYVGLLGQVARPGVFEIENRGTLLGDLLQEIGGLAKDASGQFRIVRNGRPGQAMSYSAAAQFELMPGDLVIADAQPTPPTRSATSDKPAEADAVQLGFINLLDRPVVLKLRRDDASVYTILSILRQDQSLASQIKFITPSSQRFQGQPRPDTTLASETVLIFPPKSVKPDRFAAELPEPFRLRREADNSSSRSSPPPLQRSNDEPNYSHIAPQQSSAGVPHDSELLSQPKRVSARPAVQRPQAAEEAPPADEPSALPKRTTGIRGKPGASNAIQDRISRDSDMVLAPPAEAQADPSDDLPMAKQMPQRAQDQIESTLEDNDLGVEPPLLNATGKRRPIRLAKDNDADDLDPSGLLTESDLGEDTDHTTADAKWSIWPPIVAGATTVIALISITVSLRRRTQTTGATPSAAAPLHTPNPIQNSVPTPARDVLGAIIKDELPVNEERVALSSPMQFHGRPQPPKTIRLDQGHSLPKPHSPSSVRTNVKNPAAEASAQQADGRNQQAQAERPSAVVSPRPLANATQKFRLDQKQPMVVRTIPQAAPAGVAIQSQPTRSPLERALSAVQKREERRA